METLRKPYGGTDTQGRLYDGTGRLWLAGLPLLEAASAIPEYTNFSGQWEAKDMQIKSQAAFYSENAFLASSTKALRRGRPDSVL